MAKRLQTVLQRAFGAIGLVTVATSATGFMLYRQNLKKTLQLPSEFILELDLEAVDVVEKPSFDVWKVVNSRKAPREIALGSVVDGLRAAAGDGRVKALIATLHGASGGGFAQKQELRTAILDFRRKTAGSAATVAYSDSFGEAGQQGTAAYYLASAFERIYMQPTGLLSFTGLAVTTPFLKGFFDKYKVKATFLTREEYKNAANIFTEKGFTEAHREATEALLQGMENQMLPSIAQERGIDAGVLREAMAVAPLTAQQAVSRKLIDGTWYRDQVFSDPKLPGGGTVADLPRVSMARYLRAHKAASTPRLSLAELLRRYGPVPHLEAALDSWLSSRPGGSSQVTASGSLDKADGAAGKQGEVAESLRGKSGANEKPIIAVVTAVGPIRLGQEEEPDTIYSGPLCRALNAARLCPHTKAVVLRIDSTGGSAVASDAIHREVVRLREADKPVIVSMGNVAASGGYFIAAPATRIVAQPGTITGSIGVVFGKFNFSGLAEDQGINTESIATHPNALAFSPFSDFTEEQLEQANALIDGIYVDFMDKVAAGRGLSREAVREVARGRAWTGQAALEVGLVDQLGGLQDAIAAAKEAAGLPTEDEAAVQIRNLPLELPLLAQIVKALRDEPGTAMQLLLEQVGPRGAAATARGLGLPSRAADELAKTARVMGAGAGPHMLAVGLEGVSRAGS